MGKKGLGELRLHRAKMMLHTKAYGIAGKGKIHLVGVLDFPICSPMIDEHMSTRFVLRAILRTDSNTASVGTAHKTQ